MENTDNYNVPAKEETFYPCISAGTVTIEIDRFEQLVKAENMLEIIRKAYESTESYDMKSRLSLFFGPLPEKEVVF